MVVTTNKGTIVPTHFNDRFYEAFCPTCNGEAFAMNLKDLVAVLDSHC
jgi:hypothetical protein